MSQIDTENDKKINVFRFSKILCNFLNFCWTLWIGTLKRVNNKRLCCPVGFAENVFAFFEKKVVQIDTENNKKKQNFLIFQRFYAIFRTFRQTLWIASLKRVNKEKMCCPIGYSEELSAFFKMKMFQIDKENDKKNRIFQFSKIF